MCVFFIPKINCAAHQFYLYTCFNYFSLMVSYMTSKMEILTGSELSVLLWKAAKLLKSKECINTLYFTIALK